jgi:hypothetical protein
MWNVEVNIRRREQQINQEIAFQMVFSYNGFESIHFSAYDRTITARVVSPGCPTLV